MIGRERSISLLKRLIGQSRADQTELILITEESSLTRFTRSSIHQHVAERNGTAILRVVSDKRVAVVTTNIVSPSSLKDSLEKAFSLARVQQPNESFQSLPKPRPIPEVNTFSEKIEGLTPGRKVKTLERLFALTKSKGFEASGAYSHGKVELTVVNSLGVEAYQLYSDLFFHLLVQDGKGSGYAAFVSRDPDQLHIEDLAEEAMGKVSGGEPIQVDAGEYEVILEPYAVSELLAFMGYLGFHALALQEGRSFFCGALNKKLVNERVTIYDDGFDPEGLQVPFDFEGVRKEKVVFFEEGVARGVTYDSFTAGKEGKESTGHALLPPNTEGPIPINLLMKEGDSSLEEMVKSVRKGIYVTRFHYMNVVEPMRAVLTGMTRDGTFLI